MTSARRPPNSRSSPARERPLDGPAGSDVQAPIPGSVAEEFFQARRVALIGATSGNRDIWSFNARMTRSLLASDLDEIVLVSRRESMIAGRPTVASIGDHEGSPGDLCVLVVPQAVLISTIQEGVAAGWSRFLIITGQVELANREALRTMTPVPARMWGPNCTGFFLTQSNLRVMASDYDLPWRPGRRRAAVLGQSGGALGNIAVMVASLGLNVSHILSTGEEIDVGCEELLHYFALRRTTDVAIVFVEQARRPSAFLSALDACAAVELPVVIIKVGRNARARTAAQTHTGALVGDWDEFAAVATAHGAIVCSSFREASGVAAVAANSIGKRRGRRTAVFTSSGGSGVLVCDLAEQAGLDLSTLSRRAVKALTKLAKFGTAETNPFDSAQAGGTPSSLPGYLATVEADASVDTTMLLHSGTVYAEFIAQELANFSSRGHTVVTVWPGVRETPREQLLDSGVTVIDDPADACRWLAKISPSLSSPVGSRPGTSLPGRTDAHDAHDDAWLTYRAASGLLRAGGLDAPAQWGPVASEDDLAAILDEISGHYPVVVKGSGLRGHKALAGGVVTGLSRAADLRRAVQRVTRQFGLATIEEEVTAGVEVLVAVVDGEFGGMIVIGLGGAFVDAFGRQLVLGADTPLPEVTRQISRSAIGLIVGTSQGAAAIPIAGRAIAAVAKALVRLARAQGLERIEINPLIVANGRAMACDVKARRRPSTGTPTTGGTADQRSGGPPVA
jgi:acyl-CoA synthetase (NDP forming)